MGEEKVKNDDSKIEIRKSLRLLNGKSTSKRLCCQKINNKLHNNIYKLFNPSLESLPIEILLEILSYLSCQDFYSLRQVSEYFYRLEPLVWKVYQVEGSERETSEVVNQLKRLPLLKQINIDARSDCDDILYQLSRTNKNLEILNIKNCTGSTSQLYLRSCNLTRILQQCCHLHTINIIGSRFRGKKFFNLLGKMGVKLRAIISQATCTQFRAFIDAKKLNDNDRASMTAMCKNDNKKTWSIFKYFMDENMQSYKLQLQESNYFFNYFQNNTRKVKQQNKCRALVSYFLNDFIYINVEANENNNKCDFIVPELPPPSSTSTSP
ncbi:hypothetical protein HCN44_008985 [Aphidius gifuensis]|uniref:F-box domain-containing protein n=1 Tax=Aphidius gifuensis TaxID=684658 RepID=A0A834XUR2_APHGI|nr:uncharacterized protein LOC122855942 [Aphidius gifuensis]KAF7991614.1 hypothetical protein HCN44_008985 [Aphidius gifuensis]